MTTLEIILLATLWVIYGIFTAYQSTGKYDSDDIEIIGTYLVSIFFSPVIFIIRMVIGVFDSKTIK
jgi:hypothetical protein